MCPDEAGPKRHLPLWTRLGLRARVTVMFGLGALILSASMGALSYFTTRHFLVSERESTALHEAYVNASVVRDDLRVGVGVTVEAILSSADSGNQGSHSVLYYGSKWYERTFAVGPKAIPRGLLDVVETDTVATQTRVYDTQPDIVVGVPIPSIHADYFEVFDEAQLAHTLSVLAAALFVAGLLTTALGAMLGRWASGRSLRPLTGVSRAAVAIAGGELGTRLPATGADPDLAGLTSSFNRMVDQLQERIEREERFTSDVSHELRSPLTTLSATLGVLEAHAAELSPAARQALDLLGADLRRFQRMVRDLLEISRSDTSSAEVSLEEVDPGELVRHAVGAAQRSLPAGTRAPAVEVAADLDGTRLWVDKRRFERVMTNLLENASLYGGGATVVHVELGRAEGTGPPPVRVAVDDAGPGLPAPERTRVFERFYRGHAAFERGAGTGTGLGLALVAEHVRVHGGRVWADETETGGARFVIELPGEPPRGMVVEGGHHDGSSDLGTRRAPPGPVPQASVAPGAASPPPSPPPVPPDPVPTRRPRAPSP